MTNNIKSLVERRSNLDKGSKESIMKMLDEAKKQIEKGKEVKYVGVMLGVDGERKTQIEIPKHSSIKPEELVGVIAMFLNDILQDIRRNK